jgi:threonine dehydratase
MNAGTLDEIITGKVTIGDANKVLNEAAKEGKIVIPTPLIKTSDFFTKKTGARNIYLKCETFQRTGSFKIRGAYYKLFKLRSQNPSCSEVTAASAGNHAQGVALSAQMLDLDATIFVPKNAPAFKLHAIRDYGASVIEVESLFDGIKQAKRRAKKQLGHEDFFIHPFDDYDIIAGQGTIGLEIFEQIVAERLKENPEKTREELERSLKEEEFTVIVPVGGGGLIAGIAIALKKVCKCKRVKIVGVQTTAVPSMAKARDKEAAINKARMQKEQKGGRLSDEEFKKIVELSDNEFGFTIADGIKIRATGRRTFEIYQNYVDDLVMVSDRQIAGAIYNLLVREKIVAEAAAAVSFAALLSVLEEKYVKDKNVIVVISGGNIDLNLLVWTLIQQHSRECYTFRIEGEVEDRPGVLADVCHIIAENEGGIIQVHEERMRSELNPGKMFISIYVEALGKREPAAISNEIRAALEKKHYDLKVTRLE